MNEELEIFPLVIRARRSPLFRLRGQPATEQAAADLQHVRQARRARSPRPSRRWWRAASSSRTRPPACLTRRSGSAPQKLPGVTRGSLANPGLPAADRVRKRVRATQTSEPHEELASDDDAARRHRRTWPARSSWCGMIATSARAAACACERLPRAIRRRVLGVEGVRSVALDRSQATAAIRHDAGRRRDLGGFLGRLSAALRDEAPDGPDPGLPRACGRRPAPSIATAPAVDLRGRLRPARPAPPPPRGPRRDHGPGPTGRGGALKTVPGVRARPSPLDREPPDPLRPGRSRTRRGSLRLVEEALDARAAGAARCPRRPGPGSAWRTRTWGSRRWPTSWCRPWCRSRAVLLVGTNLRTFRAAWLQVRRRKSACRSSTRSSWSRRWRAASSSPRP